MNENQFTLNWLVKKIFFSNKKKFHENGKQFVKWQTVRKMANSS